MPLRGFPEDVKRGWNRRALGALPHGDRRTDRLARITGALTNVGVPYALVGGQAVALWVTTKDPAAVRTTKDVDLLLNRHDLSQARSAALSIGIDYVEILDVGMFLERTDPNPRHAVHLIWAGEKGQRKAGPRAVRPRLRRRRESPAHNEQHTVHVVRLQLVGDEAAVDDYPLHARTPG
jgi:hypothetical protein